MPLSLLPPQSCCAYSHCVSALGQFSLQEEVLPMESFSVAFWGVFFWAQGHTCVCEGLVALGHVMGREAELLGMGGLDTGAGLGEIKQRPGGRISGLGAVAEEAACPLSPSSAMGG